MPIYADSHGTALAVGVTADKRINLSASCGRKRKKNSLVNLGNVFPETIEVEAEFQLYNFGMDLLVGEFTMSTPDGLLTITNLDLVVGIEAHSPASNAIPLVTEFTEIKGVTSLYMKPGDIV